MIAAALLDGAEMQLRINADNESLRCVYDKDNALHKLIMTTLLTILILALAGCGGNLPSVGDAQQAVCEPLQSLVSTVDDLANLKVDATTNDVKELKAKVDAPLQTVRTINNTLKMQVVVDLLASYDKMTASINELPDNEPLGADIRQQVQDGVADVQSALGQAANTLKCSG